MTDDRSRRDRFLFASYASLLVAGPLAPLVLPVFYWRPELAIGGREPDAQTRLDEFTTDERGQR